MNQKQRRAQRARHPKLKPSKRQREKVLTLTAEGKNRELVATETGVSIAKLRTDYASELDFGSKTGGG
jgi:DNA-binding CsgD family transcriptional regulator